MKHTHSISTWLWALVLLPTVPLMAFFGYSTYQYAQERERQLTIALVDETEELARNAQITLEQSASALNTMAVSNAILANDIPSFYALAQRVQKLSQGLTAISLVDRDDRLVFLTLRPLGTELPATQLDSAHQVFKTGKPNLSKPFKAPISERQVVALNVPVFRDGRVIYCLRGILGIDTLAQLIKPEKMPDQWIAGIFDQDGITVARSRSPERFVGQPGGADLLRAIAHPQKAAWPGTTKEGIETLSASRQIGQWGWTVALAVPTQVLSAPLRQELMQFALLVLGTLAALALTVVLISRQITRRLASVVDDARRAIDSGLEPALSSGICELDELRFSLTHADIYRQAILEQVQQRTAELDLARRQLTEFAQQQEDNIEQERLRIAREVHDQIGAIFTGVSMLVSGLPREAMPGSQRHMLEDALNQGVAVARRITAELRPPLLDDLGLQSAVEDLIRRTLEPADVQSQVSIMDTQHLSPRQTIGCYRIVQEAVTNVLRHSQATGCHITGLLTPENGYLLTISDNGQGLAQNSDSSGHFGLSGMRERARLMNGEMHVESETGKGFVVQVFLPLTTEHPQDD